MFVIAKMSCCFVAVTAVVVCLLFCVIVKNEINRKFVLREFNSVSDTFWNVKPKKSGKTLSVYLQMGLKSCVSMREWAKKKKTEQSFTLRLPPICARQSTVQCQKVHFAWNEIRMIRFDVCLFVRTYIQQFYKRITQQHNN